MKSTCGRCPKMLGHSENPEKRNKTIQSNIHYYKNKPNISKFKEIPFLFQKSHPRKLKDLESVHMEKKISQKSEGLG